ncbi:MAG: hypothetical protein H6733_07560 [Alphaproteobacteria bacterium]|nr:hypothetical protein [Alphaproteobacteria bacterium]
MPGSRGAGLALAGLVAVAQVGCGGGAGQAAFDATSARLTAPVDVPEAGWSPDVRVFVTSGTLRALVRAALDARGPITQGLAAGSLAFQARLDVQRLDVADRTPACPACVPLSIALLGTVQGTRFDLSATAAVHADVDVGLDVDRDGDALVVTARLLDVSDVGVELGGLRETAALRDPLVRLARAQVLEALPPVQVARLDDAALPVARARAVGAEGGVEVLVRTTSPTATPVTTPAAGPTSFTVRASAASLVGLAAREALARGPVAGVIVEPRSLAVDGDTVTAGVRTWVPVPGGCGGGGTWWRDDVVTGRLTLDGPTVSLTPTGLDAAGASDDAGVLDEAARVAARAVLGALATRLTATVPARHTAEVGDLDVRVRLIKLLGEGDDLVLRGKLDVGPSDRPDRPDRPRSP